MTGSRVPDYAELHCHTALSLLDGAALPEALVERAVTLGYRGLAITDHDELGGIVRFGTACEAVRLPGILGVELTVRMPELQPRSRTEVGERRTHLVLLAETREGYRNISTLVTRARMDSERGKPSVPWALVTRHVEGVTALTGCPGGWIPQLLAEGKDDDAWTAACELRDVFGTHLTIECWDHRLPEERALVDQLRPLAQRLGVPWVVTNNVHYATPDQRIVHDVLAALKHGRTLDTMGTRLRPNAEWALKAPSLIYRRWRGAEEGVRATMDILERCAFRLEHLKPSMPAFRLPEGLTADEYLTLLVEQGAGERWGPTRTPKQDAQLAHELGMIRRMKLAGFFLTVWDIVRFARREGILCQGRGSAANSAVCYCLGITAIDPLRMNLLFERFLTEDRQEVPDIDIDFAHRDRERVLQYMYKRYGREHAAMVCEQITWRGRSAVRDAARVLGFSPEQGDVLASLSDRFSARSTADALRVDGDAKTATQAYVAYSDQKNARSTEGANATRVVRESARKVAAYAKPSAPSAPPRESVPLSAKRIATAERDANWQQLLDLRAEQKIAADERAGLGPLAKSPDGVRPGGRRRPKLDPSSRVPIDDTTGTRTALGIGGYIESSDTATRDDASGRDLLTRAGLDPDDPRVRQLAHVVDGLHQLPRHRSIHVGGFVLTEEPLGSIVPIEPASMPGRTVIQWEKDDLDPVGLVKIDLLGLGMLTVVQDCMLYVRHTRGIAIDFSQFDMSDPAVYDDMCRADTVGVFQIESRAQMQTLPRLKPRCFYDLVVEVALIRPGPIQGDMVHPYLRRRAGTEPVTYPHPSLEKVLSRTLGVPLFQEQGMQVAITAAGFTPSQADKLRRAMGHKRSRERMAQIGAELIAGMAKNGIPEEIGQRIYNQINGFADYGFPESHAASFALIVYATAWLRHYYAPEYLCAILNAQPMGFYSPATLIEDAKRHGVRVLPIDLTKSIWDHSLELSDGRTLLPNNGTVRWKNPPPITKNPTPITDQFQNTTTSPTPEPSVRLGLRLVRGLGAHARRGLEAALRNGPFASIEDAVQRASLDRTSWRRLAEAGAFDSLYAHEPEERRRRVALWDVMAATRGADLPLAPRPVSQGPPPSLPALTPVELTEADYRMTGLSLAGHPMVHARALLKPNGVLSADEALNNGKDGQRVAVAGLVICRQRPGTAKGFVFLTLEDETGLINVIITPDVFEEHALLVSTSPLLLIRGTLQVEETVVNVRAKQFRRLELGSGEQHAKGRNYH